MQSQQTKQKTKTQNKTKNKSKPSKNNPTKRTPGSGIATSNGDSCMMTTYVS